MLLDQLVNLVDRMSELSTEKVRVLGEEPCFCHGCVARKLINFEDCKRNSEISDEFYRFG